MADTHNRVGSLPVGPVRVFSPHWAPLVIAVGYYLGARLGFALTLSPIPVSILWPPNAILLAGLVLTSIRVWPLVLTAVLGAHLLVQLQSGVPTVMVLSWFVSNCTEAVLGASLLKRFGGGSSTFDTFRGAAIFAGCAGFAAPFFSSFLDAAFVAANGWGDAGYWTVWRTRVFANTLASITVVPVILTVADAAPNRKRIPLRKCLEGALGAGALALVCWVVFGLHRPGPGTSPALLYAPLPVLVAAAVRFGPLGVSVSMLICTFIAIWGAAHGKGPFVSSAPADNALAIQLFLIVAWLPVMLLAAVIRERASANEKARWSDEQLAIAIDTAQLGRWEWDFAAERLTWSDTTRRIYEVPPGVPVTPRTFETLIHPDDRAIVAAASANALASRGIDVEFRVLFPDNRIKWIHSKGTTLFDADGQPVRIVGVKVDVTARKAVERHIHEQQRNLADLSRVSVAGEMSVALAHELNQPLAAILANAAAARRFLVRDPPELQELADIVEAIASDNQRAAAVITRFIAHSRRADERRSLLDVNFLAASVIDLARNDIISRGVSLVTRFDRGLPSVLGDVVQLQQVLLNLVVNACDAMEDAACDTRRLTVTTGSDGQGGVRVTVGDSGPGIAGERMEQIFEPFVTTKPHRLGLGLAICRSIVSTHDGQLDVDSQPGCGATFSMSLPAIPAGISGPRSKVGPWETDMESSSALGKVRDAD